MSAQVDASEITTVVSDASAAPGHGIEFSVELEAASLDAAVADAIRWASFHSVTLSLASRAPVWTPVARVAYDVTEGTERRAFRQWVSNVPLPTPTTPASKNVFGDVFKARTKDETDAVSMGSQLYQAALREDVPILRFLLLWLGCVALAPVLRRMPSVRRGRGEFAGLKAVAQSIGESNSLIEASDDLRNDVVHMNRMRSGMGDLPARASELAERLEPLLLTSVMNVLGVASADDLPSRATSPEAFSVVIDATITQADISVWTNGAHPMLVIDWGRVDYLPAQGTTLALGGDLILAKRNIDRVEDVRLRVFGASMPDAPSVTIEEKKDE